jgi:hypothetical protein
MKKLLSAIIGVASLLCFATTQAKTVKTVVLKDNLGIPYSTEYIRQSRRAAISKLQKQQTDDDVTLYLTSGIYPEYKNWNIQYNTGSSVAFDYTTNNSSYYPDGVVMGSVPEGRYNVWFTCMDNYWAGKTFDIEADWIDSNGVQKYKRMSSQATNGDILFGVEVTQGSFIYIDRWFWY